MTTTEKLPIVRLADWVPGPEQGHWTYRDYATLGDEQHYEIVNGVLLMPPVPSWSHQEIVGEIFAYLRDHLRAHALDGVFTAPIDVELSAENVFQPDVVVLLKAHADRLQERHIVGAPDLVVEVASLSTALYDRLVKYDIYARAGVLEYWIVNPENSSVEVLLVKNGHYQSLGRYSGQQKVPSQVVSGLDVSGEKFFASVW
jgi:Uma2 family endonuclease